MDEITKQYKTFGLFCLELAIMAQFFILHDVLPLVPSSTNGPSWIIKFIFFILSNSVLYLVIAKAPLLWFEKYGWKLLNKRVNIQGRWHYEVTYYSPNERLLKKDRQERLRELLTHVDKNHGEVWIDQSVFGVSVQEGTGYLGDGPSALKTTWKGNSVTISSIGTVVIYFTSNLGGIKFNGFDDLTISKRDRVGSPVEMSGHFQLVQEGTDFVLRGEMTYSR